MTEHLLSCPEKALQACCHVENDMAAGHHVTLEANSSHIPVRGPHREVGAALASALMRWVGADGASKSAEFSLPPPSGCCDCCCVLRAIFDTTCRIIALAGLCAPAAFKFTMGRPC